jgi:hypothetical protein
VAPERLKDFPTQPHHRRLDGTAAFTAWKSLRACPFPSPVLLAAWLRSHVRCKIHCCLAYSTPYLGQKRFSQHESGSSGVTKMSDPFSDTLCSVHDDIGPTLCNQSFACDALRLTLCRVGDVACIAGHHLHRAEHISRARNGVQYNWTRSSHSIRDSAHKLPQLSDDDCKSQTYSHSLSR